MQKGRKMERIESRQVPAFQITLVSLGFGSVAGAFTDSLRWAGQQSCVYCGGKCARRNTGECERHCSECRK